jgi:hypothetical protein
MKKTKVYIYTRASTAIQIDGYSLDDIDELLGTRLEEEWKISKESYATGLKYGINNYGYKWKI